MPTYFVYGALMCHPTVRTRGRRARLDHFEARFVASGLPILEPRFLGLTAQRGGTAHGVLVELADDEWAEISAHEDGYDLLEVTVTTDDGERPARSLVLREDARAPEGLPSRRYARILVDGATHFDLPVCHAYTVAEARGNPITSWFARPIGWLRDTFPWLGPYGIIGIPLALPVLGVIAVAVALWG